MTGLFKGAPPPRRLAPFLFTDCPGERVLPVGQDACGQPLPTCVSAVSSARFLCSLLTDLLENTDKDINPEAVSNISDLVSEVSQYGGVGTEELSSAS